MNCEEFNSWGYFYVTLMEAQLTGGIAHDFSHTQREKEISTHSAADENCRVQLLNQAKAMPKTPHMVLSRCLAFGFEPEVDA